MSANKPTSAKKNNDSNLKDFFTYEKKSPAKSAQVEKNDAN